MIQAKTDGEKRVCSPKRTSATWCSRLPEAGRREVLDHAAGRWSADLALRLLERSDFDARSRERLFAEAPRGQALELVSGEHTSTAEALALTTRFLECADVVDAALRRPDTKAEVERALSRLSYREAAKLWLEGQSWSSTKSPHLAEAILPVVLDAEPLDLPTQGYGVERYEKPAMISSLVGVLPPPKRLGLLNDPRHGRVVQQAVLTSEELSDAEFVACLPEIMESASAVGADAVPVLVEYVQRFPKLLEVAVNEIRQVFVRLVADGWVPTRAARAGRWDALITVAELAESPELIEALVQAAVFDMARSARPECAPLRGGWSHRRPTCRPTRPCPPSPTPRPPSASCSSTAAGTGIGWWTTLCGLPT
ncbi:hypothetical protein [Amycolatopsis sp. NPDC051102]|uniref:hypothetical protein n=1 Tax=Amycolatopsis sp. NPDC051102 TaxID=3155163 RepID=UPI00343CAD87